MASSVSLHNTAAASIPFAVARQLRLWEGPPHVAQATSRAVVFPVEESPNRCTPPLSALHRCSNGPAKDIEIANSRMGLPTAGAAIKVCHCANDPFCSYSLDWFGPP